MRECQICKQCYPDAVTNCPEDNQPTFYSIGGNPILEGKYRLEKRLGQGGMGVVYQARHSFLKTAHAIKVILPDLVGNDPQLVTRFRQEALAAAAIRHHNVVQVTDYGVAQDTMPFLVMEYVEGESLHDLLAREKRLSPEKAVDLISAVCAGVGAAHRQGIVHRDLKPLNVMILKNTTTMAEGVKILDFGLAKIKSGELLGSFIQAQTTGLMGSPYYMSPEQWMDEEPDAQADVYSLGVMLYQMLAGDVPFKGSSIPAIMQKHLNTPTPTFASIGVQVPVQIEAAVFHALEKDREKRTQSVKELVDELKTALGLSVRSLNFTGGLPMPATSVHVFTTPQARIFVDNIQVGESQPDGWLLIEGIQSGNHFLRVTKEGFRDWQSQIVCDGNPQQIAAKLEEAVGTGFLPNNSGQVSHNTPNNLGNTQGMQTGFQNTSGNVSQENLSQGNFSQGNLSQPNVSQGNAAQGNVSQANVSQGGTYQNPTQNWQSGQQYVPNPPVVKPTFSPLILAITGILGLLLLSGIGAGVAYKAGLFGNSNVNTGNNQPPVNNNTTTPTVTPTPPINIKNELVAITGGKFMMGRNDSNPEEQPAHEVTVKDFSMDKTEVTNAEYYEFIKGSGYEPPLYWTNGKPPIGEEMYPVVQVNLADAKAFAEWRSKRDGITYRLPTEDEWEYAARNGSDNNMFPWGDQWKEDRAVVFKEGNVTADQNRLKPVGSLPEGKNKWGVLDLIGNVWEWTDSEASVYPGSKLSVAQTKPPKYIVRGGSYSSKTKRESVGTGEKMASSTSRLDIQEDKKSVTLGFRLVSSK